ncbi:AAA family ATPase [Bradyrhizobium huanghuaihaiense]|uniref:AAA family ATPase n=1 Tax=Bradyrhizobium huanghuaihaiense TaxID=990078 RepID=UPI0021A991EF|nr:AAA family ATPase [Bradyrhizobium sp. CB3035]UWU73049.1 AAA family ATPase [Bradyrhizobium sp. CB3035]
MNAPGPISEAQRALRNVARDVAIAARDDRLSALRKAADTVRPFVGDGWLNAAVVVDKIYEVAQMHGLSGEPGGEREAEIMDIARSATNIQAPAAEIDAAPPSLITVTPAAWKGTEQPTQRWLATCRIPSGDLTLFSGNGGAGKTEMIVQLLVYLAAALGDWLGCVIESGPALFLSCEEPEGNIRERIERICKHRGIDPHTIPDLHLHFPDLEDTWLVTVDRFGRVIKTALFLALESWVAENKPRLVVIDSIAAVFDGEAVARRQVRAFLAMLRKLARDHDVAIVLLDHPSVRGMSDGSGTANSVDWRNSVRSMLHLSDPDKEDQDIRQLEVKKSNYGRSGEKITLRWGGLTFVTDTLGASSPHRAAADREVDELFLRLLDKRLAQGRPVHAKNAKGSAPSEFADDPEAGDVTAEAFRRAMERLFSAGKVRTVETGPASKRRQHIERVEA